MAVWGLGVINNVINWGRGAFNNLISWGIVQKTSPAGDTEIYGTRQDADTTAFLTATGITDATITSALDTLVVGLKADGIWSKMKAIYPFVGGTATTHSFNLVNTALHQITWFGGLTHDANGVTPNGTNGYGNLNLNPRTHLGSTPSFGTYCRVNNTASNKADFGSSNNDGFGHFGFITSFGNTLYKHYVSTLTATNANTQGMFHFGYNASNNLFAYKNNTLLGTLAPPVLGTAPSENTAIFAYNAGGTANSFSPRPSSFFFAGNGLTSTDNANLYLAVQKFQTTLSRQV
jgi:hypothetical protein